LGGAALGPGEALVQHPGYLVPLVEDRLDARDPSRAMRARTLTRTALTALDVALDEWSGADGAAGLEHYLAEAFAQVGDI